MKLENIPLGKKLSFTYNPSDDHQYFGKPGRLDSFTQYHFKLFKATLSYSCDWVLYPEYSFNGTSSEMGRNGPRLHYHGYIIFKDLDDFLELSYTKLSLKGKFEIDTIEDESVWYTYCKKASAIMIPMCKKRKIPYILSDKKALNSVGGGRTGATGPPSSDSEDGLDRL